MRHSRLTKWALMRAWLQTAKNGKMQPIARAISHCFTAPQPGAFEQLRAELSIPLFFFEISDLEESAHRFFENERRVFLSGRELGKTRFAESQIRRLQQPGYRLGNFPASPVTVAEYATQYDTPEVALLTAQVGKQTEDVARWIGVDLASGPDRTAVHLRDSAGKWWRDYFAQQLEGQERSPAYIRDMIERIDRFNPEQHILITTPMRRDNSAASWRAYMRAFGLGDFAIKRDWMRQFILTDGEYVATDQVDLKPHLTKSSELWAQPLGNPRSAVSIQTSAPLARTCTYKDCNDFNFHQRGGRTRHLASAQARLGKSIRSHQDRHLCWRARRHRWPMDSLARACEQAD